MSNTAYKSPEQILAERGDKPWVPCVLWIEEPGMTWQRQTVASSYQGIATAWTYHLPNSQRPGWPDGCDVTVKIEALPK